MENKEYEVLSIRGNSESGFEGMIVNSEVGLSNWNNIGTIKKYWGIHSIKRLSDNKVFTIGDSFYNSRIFESHTFIIKGFRALTIYNKICAIDTEEALHTVEYIVPVKTIKLFTSEDNEEIYDDYNKTIYLIKDNKLSSIITNLTANYAVHKDDKDVKFFVSEIAAKEYLIFNTPCISINDLLIEGKDKLPIFNLNSKKRKEIAEHLYNLVKTKI